MHKLVSSIKKQTKITLLLASMVFSFNANAQPAEIGLDAVLESLDTGLPNNNYNRRNFGHIPEGSYTKFEYDHDEDGISIEAEASYRYSADFSEYVNTTDEYVEVIDISLGLDAGGSLGCDGLDLGLEALFDFEVGDILDYLPQYITTKLATEALAQIYATPLVSTVLDGIKAMRNATLEMKQAKCDAATIETRANEIKDARRSECEEKGRRIMKGVDHSTNMDKLNSDQKKYQAAGGVTAYCNNPSYAEQLIKNIKCKVSEALPFSETITETLYDTWEIDTPAGPGFLHLTKGQLTSMFIPDFRLNQNGGSSMSTEAKIEITEFNNRSMGTAYNAIFKTYQDILNSARTKRIDDYQDLQNIFLSFDFYKNTILKNGDRNVFEDNSDENAGKIDATGIKTIKFQFENNHRVIYDNVRATTGKSAFVIGPKDGPLGSVSENQTNLQGNALEVLNLKERCWTKLPVDDGKYKWKPMNKDYKYAVTIKPERAMQLSDDMAYCQAINDISFSMLRTYMNNYGKEVGVAYVKRIAATSAYQVTKVVKTGIQEGLKDMIQNGDKKLENKCKTKGVDKMEKNYDPAINDPTITECAAREDGRTTGIPFPSCNDYVEAYKLDEVGIEKIKMNIEMLDKKTELAKLEMDKATAEFYDVLKEASR